MSDNLPEYLCVRLNGERSGSLKEFFEAEGLEKALLRKVFKKEGVEIIVNSGSEYTYLQVFASTPAQKEAAKKLVVEGYVRNNPEAAPYITNWQQIM